MCRNILHLFQWKLADIEKNLLTIKEQGFNSILISPVQPFKNQKENQRSNRTADKINKI